MSFSDIFELLGKILLVPPFYSDRESELSIAASLLAAIVGAVVGRIFVRPHRNAWVILVLLATAVGTFALYWFHLYGKAGVFYDQLLCRIVFSVSLGALVFSLGDSGDSSGP